MRYRLGGADGVKRLILSQGYERLYFSSSRKIGKNLNLYKSI